MYRFVLFVRNEFDSIIKNKLCNLFTFIEKVREVIDSEYSLGLSENSKEGLTTLFNNMKNADIDWKKVANKVGEYSKKANEFLNSPEGEKAVQDTKNFIEKFIDFIVSLFK